MSQDSQRAGLLRVPCQSMAGNLAIANYGHLERDRAGVLRQKPSTVGAPHGRLG
jgi:hypothetical protein